LLSCFPGGHVLDVLISGISLVDYTNVIGGATNVATFLIVIDCYGHDQLIMPRGWVRGQCSKRHRYGHVSLLFDLEHSILV
jgi:hypothetical protein